MAQGVITEDDRVVLADFTSPADTALGKAIAQAIRIDLLQSDLIKIAEPTDVAATLRLMKREPDGPLDEATARDVAQRAGYKAVLAGEVGALGSGYTLNARLLSPDGNTLAAFREAAFVFSARPGGSHHSCRRSSGDLAA